MRCSRPRRTDSSLVEQPHQLDVDLAAQPLEHAGCRRTSRWPAPGARSSPCARRRSTSGSCSGRPMPLEHVGVLELDVHAELAPCARRLGLAEVEQLLQGERRGSGRRTSRCRVACAASARGPAAHGPRSRSKSCTNQPCSRPRRRPAIVRRCRELRAAGHVGRPGEVRSWRQTRTPSRVLTTSGSTESAPHAPGQPVGERRVLRSVPAGAAVADHEWSGHTAPRVARASEVTGR